METKVVLKNEVEVGWRGGMVTAGPFIGPNVVWTPAQAEQFAAYLISAAKEAREQETSR